MKITPAAPDALVADYLQARIERDQALERFGEAEERLMKQMEADQRKTFRWKAGGRNHSLTYVQKSTTLIDEPGLRKALTAKVFDRYTIRKLDRKAMEEAMGDGTIDPVIVSKYVTPKPQKSYLDYRSPLTADKSETPAVGEVPVDASTAEDPTVGEKEAG
jgi:hypothetical protein